MNNRLIPSSVRLIPSSVRLILSSVRLIPSSVRLILSSVRLCVIKFIIFSLFLFLPSIQKLCKKVTFLVYTDYIVDLN